MKKVLLSCIALTAGVAMTMAQDAPAYPSQLVFTLNGQASLPGITVTQENDDDDLAIEVTGKTEAEQVTMTFDTPAGWDSFVIMAPFGEVSEKEFIKTRGEYDWMSLEVAEQYGYVAGNSVTFDITEDPDNFAYICLVKGNQVWQSPISIYFNVTKGTVSDDEPVFPKSFIVDTFNEGLKVTQGMNWGVYDINVTGEVAANSFPIVIEVPEGWDGFVCYNWSKEGEVTITENNSTPKRTRAEEIEWTSVEELLAEGYVKGNRFTFEPTYIPEYYNDQTVEIHLYKGDMAMAEYFNLTVAVTKAEPDVPEFPESFKVSVNPENLNVTQSAGYYYTIEVEGNSTEDEVTVTIDVPAGWDGIIAQTDAESDQEEANQLRKVQASEWKAIDSYIEAGYTKTNTFTFKADGEIHGGYLFLYKGDEVDAANQIMLSVDVSRFGFPEEFDVTSSVDTKQVTFAELEETDEYVKEFVQVCEENYFTNINTCETALVLSGKTSEPKATLSFDLPDGWTGVLAYKYDPSLLPPTDEENDDYRKVAPFEPGMTEGIMPAWLVEMEETTNFEFPVGEKQIYFCYLATDYSDEWGTYHLVDIANSFLIVVDVESAGSGIDSVGSATKARYYNLSGAEVSNPESGIYVKVIDGKASKVTVK